MRTSSAGSSSNCSRCWRVVQRMGSTDLMRNGSMMVLTGMASEAMLSAAGIVSVIRITGAPRLAKAARRGAPFHLLERHSFAVAPIVAITPGVVIAGAAAIAIAVIGFGIS